LAASDTQSGRISQGEFLPVSINNHSGKVVLVGGGSQSGKKQSQINPSCEIVFPNGVTVRLSGDVQPSTIGQLITLGR